MTVARELARFVVRAAYEDLSGRAREALKIHILDAIGCALGAVGSAPIRSVRSVVDRAGGRPQCTLIGGGRTTLDRAAFYNGALVRYLDFNDAYLAARETCHPSDNLAPVLAATECAAGTGQALLTALAVAYQVQCRLSDEAPVRHRGFDHTTQGACAVAAGVAKALGLDIERATHAMAIAATVSPALRVTRTGALSHWKGLAYPHAAFAVAHTTLLAAEGITGPPEAFEGNKGFMETVTGAPFAIDWTSENLERITHCSLKRYNAEVHAQSAIEAIVELVSGSSVGPDAIRRIDVDIFDVAHRIIGGGEEGDKMQVRTKEQADHSLPYMLAAAAIDGQLTPEQFAQERMMREDVQRLLHRVRVTPDASLSARFPGELPCRVRVLLEDGRTLHKEKRDYLGFASRPMSWEQARGKFGRLAAGRINPNVQHQIQSAVADLDSIRVQDLCSLLSSEATVP